MLSPYNTYKVDYSYSHGGVKRSYDFDTTLAASATEAVRIVRRWYGDMPDFRIERVYVDMGFNGEERRWFEEEL